MFTIINGYTGLGTSEILESQFNSAILSNLNFLEIEETLQMLCENLDLEINKEFLMQEEIDKSGASTVSVIVKGTLKILAYLSR